MSKKVAIVYVKDEFGVDSGEGFQRYAAAGTAMSTDSFAVDVDEKSDKDIIASIKTYAPDTIFMSGTGASLAKVLSDIRAAGITAPAISNDGFYDAGAVKTAGSAAEGMIVTSCVPPLELIPSAQPFVRHYEDRYGQVSAFALYGYVAAQVAIAAATQTHSADHHIINRQLSVGSFQTILGPVSFEKNGDPFQPILYFYSVTNGSLKYSSSSFPNPLVISR
jgi:branched-chain amino acid transport system substrate-binding protein